MEIKRLKQIEVNELGADAIELFGKELALLTVKSEGKVNTMTVGWGGLGVMWGKPVAFVVVRPERYTHGLLEREERFSLTTFGDGFKKELGYCGRVSGRDEDKIAVCGFTLSESLGVPYFEEARVALICKKLYRTDFIPEDILCKDIIEKWYGGGFHTLYIAEIEQAFS